MKEDSIVFAEENTTGIPRARARFLAQAIELEEGEPRYIIPVAVFVSIFLLASLVVWGGFISVNEVAIAEGEVIPAGLIHNVQHLEGGIVDKLHVRNGDRVKEGDTLISFDPSASESELQQMLTRQAGLQLQGERLQALVEKRDPDFSKVGESYLDLAEKQRTIYLAQVSRQESELAVVDSQVSQRRSELTRQQNQVAALRKELKIYKEQVEIRQALSKKGTVSRTELLAAQSRLAEAESEMRRTVDSVAVARTAIEESEQHRLEIFSRSNQDVELEAGTVANELAEVEGTLIRLRDRVARLELHAPVSGIIQGLVVSSSNAVVSPGQVIMQVVPVEDELIVEARIQPQDIGHVHTGQTAKVKFTSYDTSRFGSLEGTVNRISASTYLDDERNPYYRAELKLERNYLGSDPEQLKILPGMTVTADIRTGEKTILDYLLKPVTRGFSNAFKER
ncbi:MAG: HlyD family type I secretion periplasmic adaptor subunit [Candidatus Sedimenticola sp. (ex Thyasira tokunagai)]